MKEKISFLFKFYKIFLALITIPVFICNSCTGNENPISEIKNKGSIINKARHFNLQKTDSCTILTIMDPWQGAQGITMVYYLVTKGKKISVPENNSRIIEIPLERIICMSTTHIAMVSALDEEDKIVGISGSGYVYNDKIQKRIDAGLTYDIGYETGMNNELIIKLAPDLIMLYGIGGESSGYTSKIEELGLLSVFNADYLEPDPLGKAEWIKLFGVLFQKEEMADSIFISISYSYDSLKHFISKNALTRPSVLLGLPFKDTWFISPGNSYICTLISDSGGRYLWEETESEVSLPYGFESVFVRSLEADYWLNIGSINSKKEISALDSKLTDIPSYKSGMLYNNNRRMTSEGGNDYWESGILNPQVILKDIASIIHPELFVNYQLYYYKKIE